MTTMKSEGIKSESMKVQLLGTVQATSPTGVVHFLADKRYQLLAYLAYKNEWVNRDELAYLFWSDTNSEAARHNLRQLLKRLKILSLPEGVEIERERLRWHVASDVSAFKQSLQAKRDDAALELYTDVLLKGLESDEANEFHTWLFHEREALQSRWREVLLGRVKALEQTQKFSEASHYLTTLLERDPLDEDALQTYLQLAPHCHQQRQALSSYQRFVKQLGTELGLLPTSRTEHLAQLLQTSHTSVIVSDSAVSDRAAPKVVGAGTSGTSFIGRERERAEMAQMLTQADCRLLTLTAPGGMGKTRLALQLTYDLRSMFVDGVYFVALESLTSTELIPVKIAESLGLELQAKDSALAQLITFLGVKHLLFILDNYEHLIDAATLVSELIQKCPNLKILVTSRERLNLEEEWLYPLNGLTVPATSHLETLARSSAAQLFIERARRVHPDFKLSETNAKALAAICEQLEGSPLALELAAVWTRVLSLQDISEEVKKNLDFLSGASRNRSERQQSLRASFEGSWQQLTPKEQKALSHLTVFRGAFKREAATVIADAPIALLAALVDKSLLRVSSTGRYDFHPLLHQYAAEKVNESAQQQLRQKHSRYYQYVLASHEDNIQRGKQKEALEVFHQEWYDIHAALAYSVQKDTISQQETLSELVRWIDLMDTFYDSRGAHQEGLEFLSQAEAVLDETDARQRTVLARVLLEQGWCLQWLGRFEEAVASIERAFTLLPPRKERWRVRGLNTLGIIHHSRGDVTKAETYFQEALALARASHYDVYIAHVTGNLGLIAAWQGNLTRSESYHLESITLYQKLGIAHGTVRERGNLALTYCSAQRWQEARQSFEEAVTLAQDIGYKQGLAFAKVDMWRVYYQAGEYVRAKETTLEALNLSLDIRDPTLQALALASLAWVSTALGEVEAALESSSQAITLAQTLGVTPALLAALLARAHLFAKPHLFTNQGQPLQAANLASLVSLHAGSLFLDKQLAQGLLADLRPQLTEEQWLSATTYAHTPLEEVLEALNFLPKA